MGVARHVVVADTDAGGASIARRAYPRWRDNFRWLFARHGVEPRITGLYPASFDELEALPTASRDHPAPCAIFSREIAACGANYLLAWFAFGDMTLAESLRSIELFAREVMPAFLARIPPRRNESVTPPSARTGRARAHFTPHLHRHHRGILGIAQRRARSSRCAREAPP